MDRDQFEQLGEELRQIGYRQRELVEKMFHEVEEGDTHSSKELYEQLRETSNKAIEIIERQKEMFDEQIHSCINVSYEKFGDVVPNFFIC